MHKQVIPRKWRILCLKSLPKRCNSYELKQGLIDGSYPRHHLCFDDEMMSFHSSLNTLDNNKIKPESTIYRCLDNELEYQSIYAREALSIKIKTLVCSTADVQVFFFSFFVFFFLFHLPFRVWTKWEDIIDIQGSVQASAMWAVVHTSAARNRLQSQIAAHRPKAMTC